MTRHKWFYQITLTVMLAPLLACGSNLISQVTPTPTKTPTPLQVLTATPTSTPIIIEVQLPTATPVPVAGEDTTINPAIAEDPASQDVIAEEPTPTETPTPEPPTPTPVPPTPTNTFIPPTFTPVPPPTATFTPLPPTNTPQPTSPPGPQIIVSLPEGDIYSVGDTIEFEVTVRDPNGVDRFSWGVIRARVEPMGVGGDRRCNGSTECRMDGDFPAMLKGEFELGVEAISTSGQSCRELKQLYVN